MAGLSNLDIETTINSLAEMLATETDWAMLEWLKYLVEETDRRRWLINRQNGVAAELELRTLKDAQLADIKRKKIATY